MAQNCDEVFEGFQVETELLEYLLEEPEDRSEIAVSDIGEVSQD